MEEEAEKIRERGKREAEDNTQRKKPEKREKGRDRGADEER